MKTAFIIFDHMTSLDFIGPFDAIGRMKTMGHVPELTCDVCAPNSTVTDDRGLRFLPDSVNEELCDYDLLVVAGGLATRELQHDHNFVAWLRTASDVPIKASVCTGSLLLGAAGFLKGRRATTHPAAKDLLIPHCREVSSERVVDDGEVITSGGVTAGIDLGLHIVERLAGSAARDAIAKQMDFPYW